jgi:phosphatidylethanolamine-binding protein (PEBP) family uncharacterized protein
VTTPAQPGRPRASRRGVTRGVACVAAACAGLALGACSRDGRTLRPAGPGQGESIAIVTTSAVPSADAASDAPAPFGVSASWIDGGAMDPRHSCDGDATAPAVTFTQVPAAATNLALVLVDVTDGGRPLWAVDGIDPGVAATREGADPAYEAPCPPPGAMHEYLLQAFALTERVEFRPEPGSATDLASFVEAIRAAAFDSAETRSYLERM